MTALAVIICILGSIGVILFFIDIIVPIDGCLSGILGLILIGIFIGGNVGMGDEYGAPGVAIFSLIGVILGIISIRNISKNSSSGYSSSSSRAAAMKDWGESRLNDPHRCSNCLNYSDTYGKCRIDDNPKSFDDSCSKWH
jgi:hypothetical protein